MSKKFKIMLISITVLMVLSILIGTSYSIWTASYTQVGTNEISVGCFSITFTEVDSYGGGEAGNINLANTYPITEAAGSAKTPYVFKLTNTCDIAANYKVNLETLSSSNFNTDYLRIKFNEANDNSGTSSLYKDMTSGEVTLPGSTSAKQLTTGYLGAHEEITYAIRAWIDIDATTETPNVMGKTWNGKVVIVSEAARDNAVSTIKRLVADADTTSTDVIGDTGLAYDGTADNNLRYVGANPNNYVTFNNELWRIIGVMNNIETEDGESQSLLKIRRNDSLGGLSWDTSSSDVNGGSGVNQWGESEPYEGSDLMRELNYDYLGNIQVGTDGKWYNGQNDTKTKNIPESAISDSAQTMIEKVLWYLGSPNNDSGTLVQIDNEILKAPYVYEHERLATNGKICSGGTYCNDAVVRKISWVGSVAPIYPSDYLYATAGGNTNNRVSCLNTKIRDWSETAYLDCKNNDWIITSSWQWTLSPFTNASNSTYIFNVGASGIVSYNNSFENGVVYPSLYLKSSVQITGGTGTQADPYTLG